MAKKQETKEIVEKEATKKQKKVVKENKVENKTAKTTKASKVSKTEKDNPKKTKKATKKEDAKLAKTEKATKTSKDKVAKKGEAKKTTKSKSADAKSKTGENAIDMALKALYANKEAREKTLKDDDIGQIEKSKKSEKLAQPEKREHESKKDNKLKQENDYKEERKKAKENSKKAEEKRGSKNKEESTVEEETEDIVASPKIKWISIQEIKKSIQNRKVLPKEEASKINKYIFQNVLVAICIVIYFIFLNMGQLNIQNQVYVTDLKVFSICVLLLAIVLIEKSYKKEEGRLAVYGIEMIALSIITVGLIYVNLMNSSRYTYIVTSISYIIAIYYLIKSVVIYIVKRRKYFVNNMKEMIKNKED